MYRIKQLSLTAALCLTPALAAQLPTPGSVLVYPNHTTHFSIVTVTNSDISPASGSTAARFEYVMAIPTGDPFAPNCMTIEQTEFLTPADTVSVLTACHTMVPNPADGYLVVSAIDPASGKAWSHNYLQGSILTIMPNGAAWSSTALPFASPLADGKPTDLDAAGDLDFDGREYQQIPDRLSVDGFVAGFAPRLALVNLTGPADAINTVSISAWNDMEIPFSATRNFTCWFDQSLEDISPIFSPAFLAGLPNDPAELDINCDGVGDGETGWFIVDSIQVSTPAGQSVASDGALLGSFAPLGFGALAGHNMWASPETQKNGSF